MKSTLITVLLLLSVSAFSQLKVGVSAGPLFYSYESFVYDEQHSYHHSTGGGVMVGYSPNDYVNVDFSIENYWGVRQTSYVHNTFIGITGKFIPIHKRIRPYLGIGILGRQTRFRNMISTDVDGNSYTHNPSIDMIQLEPSVGVMVATSQSEKLFVNLQASRLLDNRSRTFKGVSREYCFDIGLAYYL